MKNPPPPVDARALKKWNFINLIQVLVRFSLLFTIIFDVINHVAKRKIIQFESPILITSINISVVKIYNSPNFLHEVPSDYQHLIYKIFYIIIAFFRVCI
jgi:hypothetical protein